MSNIEELIRQEIERRKKICEGIFERESDTYYQGKAVAYGELLPFIDSLPEESENHGCGVEFPHFGANYPDAKCIDGYLWDMDSYEDGIYTIGGDDPCPICNTEKWLKDVLDDEIFKTRDEALEYVKMLKSKYKHKDSLPEDASCVYDTNKLTPTPSVNIEDVARVQFASHAHVFDRKRKAVFDWQQFKEVAGIFYGFGKRDSLPEEQPSDDLEEAAEEYLRNVQKIFLNTLQHPNAKECFIAGAEWQKKHDAELIEIAYNDGITIGKTKQKEQMMKEVKFGVVCKNGERDEEDVWIELNPGSLPDYKDTDPIDFIIVKEDDRPRN